MGTTQRDCIGRRFISLSPSSFLGEPKQEEAQDIVIAFVCKAKGTSQKQHLVLLINIFRGSYNMSDSYQTSPPVTSHCHFECGAECQASPRRVMWYCGMKLSTCVCLCGGGCNAHSLQMEIRNCMSKFPRFRAKLTKAGLFRHTRVINRQAEPV